MFLYKSNISTVKMKNSFPIIHRIYPLVNLRWQSPGA